MATLFDFIKGDRAELIKRERMQQSAQNIINRVQGSPELPGPSRTGLGGIEAVPGIVDAPIDQQSLLLGVALLSETGFENMGAGQVAAAMAQRQQISEQNRQFDENQQRLTSQFNQTKTVQQEQYDDEIAIKRAKFGADLMRLNAATLLDEAELLRLENDPSKTPEAIAMAEARARALPPAMGATLQSMNESLLLQGGMINDFKPEYAVNSATQTGGAYEMFTLKSDKSPSIARQEKLAWWARKEFNEAVIVKVMSGTQASDEERARIQDFAISFTDSPELIDRKMRQLFELTRNSRGLLRDTAITEGRRNIGQPFKDFLNPSAFSQGVNAPPAVDDPPLPQE